MQRDRSLDIMKGLGIMAVMMGHLCACGFVETFHMPLFFILAGYFYRPKAISEQLVSDARRLLIPYLLAATAVLLSKMIMLGDYGHWGSYLLGIAGGYVYNTSLVGLKFAGVLALWFLPAIFVCKFVYNMLNNSRLCEYLWGGGNCIDIRRRFRLEICCFAI